MEYTIEDINLQEIEKTVRYFYGRSGMELDDFRQQAYLNIMLALKVYDSEKSSLSSHVNNAVKYTIYNNPGKRARERENYHRKNNDPDYKVIVFNQKEGIDVRDKSTSFLAPGEHDLTLEIMENKFNIPEKTNNILIERMVFDREYRDIAEEYGVSWQAIQHRVKTGIELIKEKVD